MDSSKIVTQQNYGSQLKNIEANLLDFLAEQGLPTDSVLVSVTERVNVFKNIADVISKINDEQKPRSVYISKYIAAVASGLFDAALNYLWDETILELRKRVSQYDISYFYDNAVNSPEKRKNLNSEDDLVKVNDSELIEGAKKIGLISEIGYKHLDTIRYMRNWVSAAHPNQNEITGLQLISWLETCIIEVISLPLSNGTIEIQKFLKNIKKNNISDSEAKQIAAFFLELNQEQTNNLASGLFGIYTRLDTTTQTRQNLHRLIPYLWNRVDEQARQQFGIKYGRFVANNDQTEARLALDFLDMVSGKSYIPETLLSAEIDSAVDNLLNAHRGWNNFDNEPPFAKALETLINDRGEIPLQVREKYVLSLVEVFLTNGHGISHNADVIYRSLLERLNQTQAVMAMLSFNNTLIASKLQHSLCQTKYKELLQMMKNQVSAPAIKELINEIGNYQGPMHRLKEQSDLKKKVDNMRKIIW
ncbi:hypothetical protein [Nostoc sp. PCC 7107]|uniref:hypothetical protein n=1 Tax=Nostoc sp. PCC 7107 TaxID=317936 RepID=UPI00029EFAAB|nr:hypothetical protein [Nostoc sp. PCC 7107]AFY42916.1 hypothetical protein Nos7107_2305 [Nostoc sp. PCC 7107]